MSCEAQFDVFTTVPSSRNDVSLFSKRRGNGSIRPRGHAGGIRGELRCVQHSSNTDVVVLWQSILAAEDFLEIGDIDGQFGPATRTATIAWRKRYDLTADGMVGNATWSRADDRLAWLSSSQVVYSAGHQSGAVSFFRGDSSKRTDSGAYKLAAVHQYDRVKNRGGTRVHFNSSNAGEPP
ncbi:peptidoglycan-binding protein [Streptomyces sp. NPDC049627]|uniref:peptidoglycan-binding protein n=1 Tax=Streptomyces sp. NPDC049627 TaxID=3365595 RepID=UPI00378EDE3E